MGDSTLPEYHDRFPCVKAIATEIVLHGLTLANSPALLHIKQSARGELLNVPRELEV
jgi:hypothetical protein